MVEYRFDNRLTLTKMPMVFPPFGLKSGYPAYVNGIRHDQLIAAPDGVRWSTTERELLQQVHAGTLFAIEFPQESMTQFRDWEACVDHFEVAGPLQVAWA